MYIVILGPVIRILVHFLSPACRERMILVALEFCQASCVRRQAAHFSVSAKTLLKF